MKKIKGLTDKEKLKNAINYINKLYSDNLEENDTLDTEHWNIMSSIVECPEYDLPF